MADPLAPGLLIAVPQLLDPNFAHSVVFLVEHHAGGTLGLMINRPSDLKMGEVFEKLSLGPCGDPLAGVLVGGPVQPQTGMAIHAQGNTGEDSHLVTGAIFVSSSLACLRRIFGKPSSRALFFLGYAAWGPDQLTEEIESGSWIPAPVDEDLVFDMDRPVVWEMALRGLGIDPRRLVPGASDSGLN